ncbi:transposase [Tritonibacter horizontis]|uniref:transposase n=1 Tax=Tritonibacter horizontis TaxID=1768241 RepID=UPI001E31602E|nr:transposase [Tritonibacter horizontis]
MIDSGHFGDGVARRTKRLWTDEEKRSICFQTTAPGVSVAQVAQRYAVNANLIFTWLRDGRYAPDPALFASSSAEARFLPVEIVAEARPPLAAPVVDNLTSHECERPAGPARSYPPASIPTPSAASQRTVCQINRGVKVARRNTFQPLKAIRH